MGTGSRYEQSQSMRLATVVNATVVNATVVNATKNDVQSILQRYGKAAQSPRAASAVYSHEQKYDSGKRRG